MKKNYSDPLVFASRIMLTTIPLTPSQEGDDPPDVPWSNPTMSVFSINSTSGVSTSEEPVTIVNPVEEATTSVSIESAAESVSTSTLEVAPVIDEIVPEATEETATSGVTVY